VKHCWFLALIALLVAATSAMAQQPDPPTGIEKMADLWRLPEIGMGTLPFQESSTDPTGLNDDGFSGLHSRLYWENGEHVLFDAYGPGCVYRMWFTFVLPNIDTLVKFYLGNSPIPITTMHLRDMFEDSEAPFLFPLAYNDDVSSGGFASYVPICYQDRLRITTDGYLNFYQITAHQYSGDVPVESYTGNEDYAEIRTLYDPASAGSDPKDTTGVTYQADAYTLAPGESAMLAEFQGPGHIASIRLTPTAINPELLNHVYLVASFNGAQTPQVETQLGMFFGRTTDGIDVEALLFGIKSGVLYSYFPMPFYDGATLSIENRSSNPVELDAEIGSTTAPPDDYTGTFETINNLTAPTIFGRDHQFANLEGQGKLLGVVQVAAGSSGQTYLEGDERFYPDGLLTPTVIGTGTEDYYNSGWYFDRGRFSLPTHGFVADETIDGFRISAMYRLHVGDTFDFADGAKFSIEHDATNLATDEIYRSCSFAYRIDEPSLVLQDTFDVGNREDELAHDYIGSHDTPTGSNVFFYEGDEDLVPIVDNGFQSRGSVSFRVRVNPGNDGLRIVRRIDQANGRDLVKVGVDYFGDIPMYAPARNAFKRWRDVVVDIPARYTKGESEVSIDFDSTEEFSQYHYKIYAWKRPILTRMTALTLSASSDELTIAWNSLLLSVEGTYPSGNLEQTAGWVEYEISDPSVLSIEHGIARGLTPGTVTVTAYTDTLRSNSITLTVVSGSDDDDDDNDDDTASDDDDDTPPPDGFGGSSDDDGCCG
jgi:D-arabinan exo alpha-(1,3)/(1,5)-arabinofuranosidase (non-reducing end)